jgi:hypothetical protein
VDLSSVKWHINVPTERTVKASNDTVGVKTLGKEKGETHTQFVP